MMYRLYAICAISIMAINVYAEENYSAYNDVLVAQMTNRVQLHFPYNINTDYVTTSEINNGTVTSSTNFASLQTNTTANGSARLASRSRLHYSSGQGCVAAFSARFVTGGTTDNTRVIGLGNEQDGFFFGYRETEFGIIHRANSVDYFTEQSSWNGDVMDGMGSSGVTLNPQNGNNYKVQFQWLGFGAIKFYIENPSDGSWILVHTIEYANTYETTSLLDPNLQLWASNINSSGSTTDVELQTAAMSGQIEGLINTLFDTRYSAPSNPFIGVSVSSSIVNLLTIFNKSQYQSKNNQIMVYPDELSIMAVGQTSRNVIIRVHLNPTLGVASSSFADISTDTSVVSYYPLTTTVTGGKLIATFYLHGGERKNINLSDYEISLAPGDQLVVSGVRDTGAQSAIVHASLSWKERF